MEGPDSFFRILQEELGKTLLAEGPVFLSTHPLTEKRIKELGALAEETGSAVEREATPLAETLTTLDRGGSE